MYVYFYLYGDNSEKCPALLKNFFQAILKLDPFCSFLKVYRSTAILSSLLFKAYDKLSTAQKIEWNNR